MPDKKRFTRRRLLQASAATAAGAGAVGSASALGGDDGVEVGDDELLASAERIPLVEIRDETERLEGGLPEQAHGIRPGSQMFIEFDDGTAGCTANFIWRAAGGGSSSQDDDGGNDGGGPPDDPGGGNGNDGGPQERDSTDDTDGDADGQLYIGAAGHCFLDEGDEGGEPGEDGYAANSVAVCDDCTFGGATGLVVARGETIELGEVVYARQESADGEQVGHDFGIVEVPEDKEHLVDPSMPQFGGPNEVFDEALPEGTPVNQYGAGVGNGEVFPTMGSNGVSFGDGGTDDDAWFAGIRASPGDSGSPLQSTSDGDPVEGDQTGGILTHLTTTGTGGTTIGRCKEMVKEDIGLDIDVVLPD